MTKPVANTQRALIIGGSGFIGSAVVRALTQRHDIDPVVIKGPRLRTDASTLHSILKTAREHTRIFSNIIRSGDIVVNAAGIAEAQSSDIDALIGANALLPAAALLAAGQMGAGRFVQVSSAAVQGSSPTLDESQMRAPFSPYSLSKSLGEELVLSTDVQVERVVYRPPSVHGLDRPITRRVAALARSSFRSVAGDGTQPSPQAHVDNVADAIAHLCTARNLKSVVMHPWEGLTTSDLLELLGGGRRPRHVPMRVARLAIEAGRIAAGRSAGGKAHLRRLELLWFGQRQAVSWLTEQGWRPPVGREGWTTIGHELARWKK